MSDVEEEIAVIVEVATRKKRANAIVGQNVYAPLQINRQEARMVDVVVEPKPRLRMILRREPKGGELEEVDFTLKVGGEEIVSKTNENGLLSEEIPKDQTEGTLIVWPDGKDQTGFSFKLKLGELKPRTDTEGVQARLANLAIYGGALDGNADSELTKKAIGDFQARIGEDRTGAVTEGVKAKLGEIFEDED